MPDSLAQLRELAREAGCQVHYLSQGMGWQQGDFRLTCLWPAEGYRGESNASSACYLLEQGVFRILLTGDVEGQGERELTAYLEVSAGGGCIESGPSWFPVFHFPGLSAGGSAPLSAGLRRSGQFLWASPWGNAGAAGGSGKPGCTDAGERCRDDSPVTETIIYGNI